MVKLLLDWANETNTADQSHGPEDMSQSDNKDAKQSQYDLQVERLKNCFNFVFLVPLKNVNSNIALEQVIIQEHGLDHKNITEDEIKLIINNQRCLLILDAYDEYKKGTNFAIDATIKGRMKMTSVIITSRPDYMDRKDKMELDFHIQNNGFGVSGVKACAERYLEDVEKAKNFLKKTVDQGMSELLRIPILLLMMCTLYIQNNTLPKNRTKIVRDIIDMYILRAKERGVELDNRDRMLFLLGKLSYEASQRDTHKVHIRKVSVS